MRRDTRKWCSPVAGVSLGVACLIATAALPQIAPAADVAVGIVQDEAGHPLRRSPMQVRNPHDAVVAESTTGDNGAYCIGAENLEDDEFSVCTLVRAGKGACADGQANTVAGILLGENGSPIDRSEVSVRTRGGMVIAVGRTDRDGLYCVTDDEIHPGRLYNVCVSPPSIGHIAGGVNGAAFGAESAPLRLARISARNRADKLVAEGRTGYDGTYCLTDDAIEPGVRHHVCFEVTAGAATCSGGTPTAVSGAFTERDGTPIGNAPLAIRDGDGGVVAEGRTNENGAYCVVDAALHAGAAYDVCIDLIPHCACCCNCCCGAGLLYIAPTPLGWTALGTAAATGVGVGVALTGGEKEISPSK